MRKWLAQTGVALVLLLVSTASLALPCAGFTDVDDTSPFCANVTWLKNRGITLGCTSATLYCPNDFVSRLQMAAFMNRLGDNLFPLTCAAGQVMKWDGLQWACANDAIGGGGGGGTVTSVAAGTGLQGSPNPITGAGSINLAPAYQLPQACTNGQVPKSNGAGGWACGTDTAGTGTVTSVTAGTGLTGGTITASGTLAVNTTAIQSRVSGTCDAGSSIRVIAADGSVTCQTDSSGPANAFVQGGNSFGTTATLGTNDAQAVEIRANGTTALRIVPTPQSPNIIGGHAGNSVGAGLYGATIGGGGTSTLENRVGGDLGTVGGGQKNLANGYGATIGGGTDNTATEDSTVAGGSHNQATGSAATIGGGVFNVASSNQAVVGGGALNVASSLNATIGGGYGNEVSGGSPIANGTVGGGMFNKVTEYAGTIAGGYFNEASGAGATIGGGGWNGSAPGGNQARGPASTISGGFRNVVSADGGFGTVGGGVQNQISAPAGTNLGIATIAGGYNNQVTRGGGTVGGGNSNTVSNFDATVAGGNGNTASGQASMVPGGLGNLAQGFGSFAAGRRAKANSDGCFAWADANDVDFACGASNAFTARATGGVYFISAINGAGTPTAGVQLPAGGNAWSALSDRASKDDLTPANPDEVLARVAALPIYTWRYRTELSGALHMGPVAQDFSAAFGLGDSDKRITTVDADGVALAAIQGLNAKVEARDAAIRSEILDKDTRIDAQARRISELEARVAVAESMHAELLALRATRDDVAVMKAALQELLRERAGGVTQARLAPAKP